MPQLDINNYKAAAWTSNLFVHDWKYVTNWPYVVLSRGCHQDAQRFVFLKTTTKYGFDQICNVQSIAQDVGEVSLHKMISNILDDEYEELFPST